MAVSVLRPANAPDLTNRQRDMSETTEQIDAGAAGTITLGGELTVSRMGFGVMRLMGEGIWGPPDDPEEAKRILRLALELGVDFLDTADAYGPELDEYLIAETLHPYPDGVVIATKGGVVRSGPDGWERDGRPEHLRRAVENSLRRLRLDRIDLYQLHAPDPEVPVEDSVGELARLREEGKIRLVGVSNFSVDQLERVRQIVPIASVQNQYNVLFREESEGVLEWCEAAGIAFIPWQPVARGELESEVLRKVATEREATPAQIALAWLLHRSPLVLPIPGTSSEAHLRENIAAASIRLGKEEMARLDGAG
jgi:pyridoxine 4-dehydrogenase